VDRSIFLTLSTGRTTSGGFAIETKNDFDGFTRNAEDSEKKAKEFGKLVDKWEKDHPLLGQNVSRPTPLSSR
jgi:hypothetical protein